jgi:hypothetical protein
MNIRDNIMQTRNAIDCAGIENEAESIFVAVSSSFFWYMKKNADTRQIKNARLVPISEKVAENGKRMIAEIIAMIVATACLFNSPIIKEYEDSGKLADSSKVLIGSSGAGALICAMHRHNGVANA